MGEGYDSSIARHSKRGLVESQLFTIVALVIAISGAAFTFIVTIRELTSKLVTNLLERAAQYSENVAKEGTKSLKGQAFCGRWIITISYWAWFFSLIAPIVLFAWYSLDSADLVLESYDRRMKESTPEPLAGPDVVAGNGGMMLDEVWCASCIEKQMSWLWWIKRLDIIAVVIAGLTIPIMYLGLGLLAWASNTIEEHHQIAPKQDSGSQDRDDNSPTTE